jgi:hypothetical protein
MSNLAVLPVYWREKNAVAEMVGYASDGQRVFLRIDCYYQYDLFFDEPVTKETEKTVSAMFDQFQVHSISTMIGDRIMSVLCKKRASFEKDFVAPWQSMLYEPNGLLAALWERCSIEPYEWFTISKYRPLPEAYNNFDLSLGLFETQIDSYCPDEDELDKNIVSLDTLRTMIFSAVIIGKTIRSMSFILFNEHNSEKYHISCDATYKDEDPNTTVVTVDDERRIIKYFLEMVKGLCPDRICVNSNRELSVFQEKSETTFTQDVIVFERYYQRFTPYDPNPKFKSLEALHVAHSKISEHLMTACNNASVSIDTMLNTDYRSIIDEMVYSIDMSCTLGLGAYDSCVTEKFAEPGIYRDVFCYDYSELCLELMKNSDRELVQDLAVRLQSCPSGLIGAAMSMFDIKVPAETFKDQKIISVDSMLVRATDSIKISGLKLVQVSFYHLVNDNFSADLFCEDSFAVRGYLSDVQSDLIKAYLESIADEAVDPEDLYRVAMFSYHDEENAASLIKTANRFIKDLLDLHIH